MPGTTPPSAASGPASRQQIGHYQLLAKNGEGGMGELFRARDTRLNREVPVKVLPQAFADDPPSNGALSARSAAACLAEPSEDSGDLRARRIRLKASAGHGTGRKTHAGRADRPVSDSC